MIFFCFFSCFQATQQTNNYKSWSQRVSWAQLDNRKKISWHKHYGQEALAIFFCPRLRWLIRHSSNAGKLSFAVCTQKISNSCAIKVSIFLRLTQQAVLDKDEHTPAVDVEAIDTESGEVLTDFHQSQVYEESYQSNKDQVEGSTHSSDVVLALNNERMSEQVNVARVRYLYMYAWVSEQWACERSHTHSHQTIPI